MNEGKRRRWWWMAAGWVGLIYSTLYIVRPVCEFLKAKTPFSLFINSFLITGVVVLLASVLPRIREKGWRGAAGLAVILAGYGYGLLTIAHPEEKIHFFEYGVLACLICQALCFDLKGWRPYFGAFLLASLIGWGDEGIQHLLPNRYYQWRDVFLNSAGSFLGLVWFSLGGSTDNT